MPCMAMTPGRANSGVSGKPYSKPKKGPGTPMRLGDGGVNGKEYHHIGDIHRPGTPLYNAVAQAMGKPYHPLNKLAKTIRGPR